MCTTAIKKTQGIALFIIDVCIHYCFLEKTIYFNVLNKVNSVKRCEIEFSKGPKNQKSTGKKKKKISFEQYGKHVTANNSQLTNYY